MARLQRIAPLGIPQHIIQRGNNRQTCFAWINKWGQMKLISLWIGNQWHQTRLILGLKGKQSGTDQNNRGQTTINPTSELKGSVTNEKY